MKILVVGGGGREHAIAWRLSKSPSITQIFASPGNPGIAQLGTCIPAPNEVSGYAKIAEEYDVDLTVVGPEAPLIAGIVDDFRSRKLTIIGPTQRAAQLEGSKIFAKQFFERADIPTARSIQTTTEDEAKKSLKKFGLPVVVKADGLAAGKGVVIAQTEDEAKRAIEQLGPTLVIEEFLEGEEVSFIGLSDGSQIFPFVPSQDHKRIHDGDKGPNTGGMGAYCCKALLSPKETGQVLDQIMHPAIAHMAKEGSPFTGFLYAGLMLTQDGPKVLEFNARLGDPETQAILHSTEGDLGEFFLNPSSARIHVENPSVCVVLAAQNYPDKPVVGQTITGIAEAEAVGATVFHAGTKKKDGHLVTNGGRVLGITASGQNLKEAIHAAYLAAAKISFEGMQFRTDIGKRGIQKDC